MLAHRGMAAIAVSLMARSPSQTVPDYVLAKCKYCKQGEFQFCEKGQINGVNRNGGNKSSAQLSISERLTLRLQDTENMLHSDPKPWFPFRKNSTQLRSLPCCVLVLQHLMASANKRSVLASWLVCSDFPSISCISLTASKAIQGLGALGHLAIQFYSKMGYRVVAISSSDAKAGIARDLGAHEYIDTSKQDVTGTLLSMGGAAAVVLTGPNPAGIKPLMMGMAKRGKMLILSACGDVPITTGLAIRNGWTFSGWPSGHVIDSEETVAFAERNGVKCLVEKFKFADWQNAYQQMEQGKARFRAVLVM